MWIKHGKTYKEVTGVQYINEYKKRGYVPCEKPPIPPKAKPHKKAVKADAADEQ